MELETECILRPNLGTSADVPDVPSRTSMVAIFANAAKHRLFSVFSDIVIVIDIVEKYGVSPFPTIYANIKFTIWQPNLD